MKRLRLGGRLEHPGHPGGTKCLVLALIEWGAIGCAFLTQLPSYDRSGDFEPLDRMLFFMLFAVPATAIQAINCFAGLVHVVGVAFKKISCNRLCMLGFALSVLYVGIAAAMVIPLYLPSGPEHDEVWREYAKTVEAPSREIVIDGPLGNLSMAISAHHGKAAYLMMDKYALRVVGLDSGEEMAKLENPLSVALSTAISSDGRKVIAGGDRGQLCIWDLDRSEMIHHGKDHTDYIRAVAFSPGGDQALVADDSKGVFLYDLEKLQIMRRFFAGHPGGIEENCLAWCTNGKAFLSAGMMDSIRLWDIETGRELACLNPGGAPQNLSVSVDGRYALSSHRRSENLVVYWDLEACREINRFAVDGDVFGPDKTYVVSTGTGFAPDGETALFGLGFGTVIWWDLKEWKQLGMNRLFKHELASVAFSGDGSECIALGIDGDDCEDKARLKFWKLPAAVSEL